MNHITKIPTGPMFSFGGFAADSSLRARFGGMYQSSGGDSAGTQVLDQDPSSPTYGQMVTLDANSQTQNYSDSQQNTDLYNLDGADNSSSAASSDASSGSSFLTGLSNIFKLVSTPARPVMPTVARPATNNTALIAVVIVVVIVVVIAMGSKHNTVGVAS